MAGLTRFEAHRFVGTRDDMRVYDCEDAEQLAALVERVETDDLMRRKMLQSFGPDTLVEARNRGFRALRRATGD
ncbi:MAG: hypothetical protein R2823_09925 [Acidimicrobiia bacterium]